MARARVLVVYYSRDGHARQVAGEVAAALGADLEEIRDPADRTGMLGYLRCAAEALLGASAEIERPAHDPGGYELVVVGTPVWYAAVSSPVRTYLWMERERLPRVAFFLAHGGFGSERVLAQMTALAGKRPAARLVLRQREIEDGAQGGKVARFAKDVEGALRGAAARSRRAGRAR